jgi:hypothetical protein
MVLIRQIRSFVAVLGFIFLSVCFSCEEDIELGVICTECENSEPKQAELELKLEGDYGYRSTLVKIYEGNLEDSILFKSFETVSNKRTILVPINKKYTVTATYYRNTITYIAVNSAFPRVRYDEISCENPCYWVYDKTINLRLK